MPRGIPWDDIPRPYGIQQLLDKKPAVVQTPTPLVGDLETEERDFQKDSLNIGRRMAFGVVCGGLTGFAFGTIDIVRDTKAMTAKKSVVTAKLMRYVGIFGGFFAAYHGTRKALQLYYPQPPTENLLLSAAICVPPMLLTSTSRAFIPHALLLIILDAINGIDDM